MIADLNNFFFECDRSNSNAKIPHATVGRAAPATNRRRQSFTASLTCATRAGSSLLIAAVINTTHKTRPKAFNNIRALINRCPTGEPLHHSRLAFAAQPTMCGPAGEIPPDPDFALGVSLKLENKGKQDHESRSGAHAGHDRWSSLVLVRSITPMLRVRRASRSAISATTNGQKASSQKW